MKPQEFPSTEVQVVISQNKPVMHSSLVLISLVSSGKWKTNQGYQQQTLKCTRYEEKHPWGISNF